MLSSFYKNSTLTQIHPTHLTVHRMNHDLQGVILSGLQLNLRLQDHSIFLRLKHSALGFCERSGQGLKELNPLIHKPLTIVTNPQKYYHHQQHLVKQIEGKNIPMYAVSAL